MTASTTDYYGILGLTSDATSTDVMKAYRKLARQHHPDRNRPGPAAPPRTDVGRPDGYFEPASRVLTMLVETWQAIRAHNPEIPPVVIIIASGTAGRDVGWGRFDPQRRTIHTTGTLTKILLIQTTPVTRLQGWLGERRPRAWQTPPRS